MSFSSELSRTLLGLSNAVLTLTGLNKMTQIIPETKSNNELRKQKYNEMIDFIIDSELVPFANQVFNKPKEANASILCKNLHDLQARSSVDNLSRYTLVPRES